MPPQIDHMILSGNDRAKSVEFYTRVLGFAYEGQGERTPSSVIRVTPGFILQSAPFGTTGNEHLAFSMSSVEFDQVFQRVRDHAIEYADSFDRVCDMRGPCASEGARGAWQAVYFFDPNRSSSRLLTIYDDAR